VRLRFYLFSCRCDGLFTRDFVMSSSPTWVFDSDLLAAAYLYLT
jgi:hypothetical protein